MVNPDITTGQSPSKEALVALTRHPLGRGMLLDVETWRCRGCENNWMMHRHGHSQKWSIKDYLTGQRGWWRWIDVMLIKNPIGNWLCLLPTLSTIFRMTVTECDKMWHWCHRCLLADVEGCRMPITAHEDMKLAVYVDGSCKKLLWAGEVNWWSGLADNEKVLPGHCRGP